MSKTCVLFQKTLYIVDLKRQKCYKKKMTRPFRERCIPDTAKCVGHFYMGSGTNKLQGDTYYVDFRGKGMTRLHIYASVTKNCIPIGEALFGRVKGMAIEETVGFANFRLGIKDPSVFDVPKQCDDGRFEVLPVKDELSQYRILGF
ncbi:uncharacterized protein LOC121367153 [Gigantopelta aegis]|uniref:uncharacterized protein LOC121367153 n=1 Tax=Gigantopelta aegis TaxID=1735272 RepID=UPI001B88A067|nr:uncharacterized protein LOC121367153 [Gigantopelta aegis]